MRLLLLYSDAQWGFVTSLSTSGLLVSSDEVRSWCFSFLTCRGTLSISTTCGKFTLLTTPGYDTEVHHFSQFLIHTATPVLYPSSPSLPGVVSTARCSWVGRTQSCTSQLYTPLAGASVIVVPSRSVTLYKWAALVIEHCFLAAITFAVWWFRSTMLLPVGAYAALKRSNMRQRLQIAVRGKGCHYR